MEMTLYGTGVSAMSNCEIHMESVKHQGGPSWFRNALLLMYCPPAFPAIPSAHPPSPNHPSTSTHALRLAPCRYFIGVIKALEDMGVVGRGKTPCAGASAGAIVTTAWTAGEEQEGRG